MEQNSTSAQIILSIVPIVGIIAGSILLIFFIWWRYRIQKLIIESGNYQENFWKNIKIWSLLVGTVSTALGLPMTILFIIVDGVKYSLLGGLIPFSVGIGFIVFYVVIHRRGTS